MSQFVYVYIRPLDHHIKEPKQVWHPLKTLYLNVVWKRQPKTAMWQTSWEQTPLPLGIRRCQASSANYRLGHELYISLNPFQSYRYKKPHTWEKLTWRRGRWQLGRLTKLFERNRAKFGHIFRPFFRARNFLLRGIPLLFIFWQKYLFDSCGSNQVGSKQSCLCSKYLLKIIDDWIWTMDFWCQNELSCPLCHNYFNFKCKFWNIFLVFGIFGTLY